MSQPAAAADKQTALVDAISTGVANKVADSLANLTLGVNTIIARVDAMEAAIALLKAGGEGEVVLKRPVRNGPSVAKGGKKAGGAKNPEGVKKNISNTQLYVCHGVIEDCFGMREAFCSEDQLAEIEKDPSMAKKNRAEDERAYFSAVGRCIWAKLEKPKREELRAQYVAWKEQISREEARRPQLELELGLGLEEDAEDE